MPEFMAVISLLIAIAGIGVKFLQLCKAQSFTTNVTVYPVDKRHHLGVEGTQSEVGQYIVELIIDSVPPGRFNDEYLVFVSGGKICNFVKEANEQRWTADRLTGFNSTQVPSTYTLSPTSSKTILLKAGDRQYTRIGIQSSKCRICGKFCSSQVSVFPLCWGVIPNIFMRETTHLSRRSTTQSE